MRQRHALVVNAVPLILLVLSLCLATATLQAATLPEMLDLHSGAVRVLDTGEVERVVVGDDARLGHSVLEGGRLLLIGLEPGTSDLRVWTRDGAEYAYSVQVHPRDLAAVVGTLSALLADFQGARVRAINGIIVVDGTVPRTQIEGVREIVGQIPGVVSLVEPATAPIDLVMSSFAGVRVREVDGVSVVEGEVAESEYARFAQAMQGFPNAVSLVRSTRFNPLPMVRVSLRILEVNREYTRRLGINWDAAFPGPSIGSTGASIANTRFRVVPNGLDSLVSRINIDDARWFAYAGWTTRVFSTVDMLQLDNQATTLAEPNLTTRSGEPATFFAGGEFPYPVIGQFGQPGVEFKDYGIRFEIQPTADLNGNVQTSVRAEISTLDRANTVADVPGLLKRETESTVTLRSGQTMIISGLVSADEVKNANGIPGLSEIPVLGNLFKSRSFQNRKTELVVLVTPTLVQDADRVGEGVESTTRRMRGLLDELILEGALAE
ncbi:type II and III secretion system protein family protein [Aquimonas voraii]|uniref:Pilus formation protein N terminal region n=1 Tax=Aquimonas voraii TaxID=265719 RepID=A0A1G6WTU2_9GAMM|nr:pilus assembly protein N-terminal domain-containing protein [Aquimonas voraii]SDD69308.1 Pilus formation protein N terminal region [Aquimonas voraii]